MFRIMDGLGVAIIAINKIKVYMYFLTSLRPSTILLMSKVNTGVLINNPVKSVVEIIILIVSYTDRFWITISLSARSKSRKYGVTKKNPMPQPSKKKVWPIIKLYPILFLSKSVKPVLEKLYIDSNQRGEENMRLNTKLRNILVLKYSTGL